MDAFTFLAGSPSAVSPVYALVGDERFLKHQVLRRIETLLAGGENSDLDRTIHSDDAAWAEVHDDLHTISFWGTLRLVVVQDADKFVTQHRKRLEQYVARPSSAGILVLDVKNWPKTTLLAKAVPDAATIHCDPLKPQSLSAWCRKWTQERHGKRLSAAAATLLVEMVGSEMGLLAQEIAKLSTYVGNRESIETQDVDRLVGQSRVETVWKMLDALAEGQPAQAFAALEHLLHQGQEPLAILAAMSWQLRRLAQAARLLELGQPLDAALGQAGIPPFNRPRAGVQLRRLGPRGRKIFDWLIETDLAMKSTDALPPRLMLERLLVLLGPAA